MKDRSEMVWNRRPGVLVRNGMLRLGNLTNISQQKQKTGSSMNRYLLE